GEQLGARLALPPYHNPPLHRADSRLQRHAPDPRWVRRAAQAAPPDRDRHHAPHEAGRQKDREKDGEKDRGKGGEKDRETARLIRREWRASLLTRIVFPEMFQTR